MDISLEWLKDFTGDGVVFDSRSYEPVFRRCRFKPDDPQSTPTANCIVFEDDYGDNPPTQVMIGEGVNTDGNHNVSVLCRTGVPSLFVAGKYEGANGRATIDAEASGGMNLYVTPKTQIGNNHDGAHGVYFKGYKAVISPSYITQVDGDGIVVDGGAHVSIDSGISFNGISGDSINVNHNNSSNNIVVPHENTIGQDTETVNYPDPPWRGVRYIDGWQLFRQGEDVIPAGSSKQVTAYGTDTGEEHKATVEFYAKPSADVEVQKRIGWSTSTSHPKLVLEEKTGNADAEVRWRLFKR